MAAAVLGPFAIMRAVFGLLGLNIGAVSTAMRLLAVVMRGLMFTPMGLALTALAVAAYLLYTRWDDVRAGAIALWQDLSAAFAAGVAAVGAAFDRLVGWAQRTWQGITTTLGGLWSDVAATLATLPQRFFEFGANIIQGLANGITNRIGLVRDAIGQAADGAVGWFKEKLGIRSPSRVFIEAGANIAQGAALGIDRTAPQVRAAALGMAAASLVALPAMALPAVGQPAGLSALAPTHAPLASTRSSGPGMVVQGDTVHLTIQAGAGVDPAAIAQLVRAELARHEQAKAARLRGAYVDYGN